MDYNTFKYYQIELVSFGPGYDVEVDDEMIEFKDNIISKFDQFDKRNLFMCQCLNLRSSSFKDFDASLMFSLIYIDIVKSQIKTLDLTCCLKL